MPFFTIRLCHSYKCWKVQGDFVGRLWTVSDGNQPTLSSLLSPNSSTQAPCTVQYSLFSVNAMANRNKKRPHILFMCQKCGEKRVGRWGQGRITLSLGWYLSIRADQFSQTEGDERGARRRRTEGGSSEMVVVLICQRNTALRVLLKRPHKPELSEVGGRLLTSGHTNIDCGFSAWLSCMQSHPSTSRETGKVGPTCSKPCHISMTHGTNTHVLGQKRVYN